MNIINHDFLIKYSRKAYATRIGLLLMDISLSIFSLFFAAWLRQNFDTKIALILFKDLIFLVLPIRILLFRYLRTYAVILDPQGIFNIVQVVNAALLGSLAIFIFVLIFGFIGINLSISIVIIDFFILVILLGSYRFVFPVLFKNKKWGSKKSIIIVGGGKLGLLAKQIIDYDQNGIYKVIAFIDENPNLLNKYLDGVPVESIKNLKKFQGGKAILAIEDNDNLDKTKIVDVCLSNQIEILKMPSYDFWPSNNLSVKHIQKYQIEDLLGRPAIKNLNLNSEKFYAGKTILVTGAAGSIGSEIVRQLISFHPGKLILIDQAETPLVNLFLECKEKLNFAHQVPYLCSVTNERKLNEIFDKERPQIIFHTAAYKHVPIIEDHPKEAIFTNVFGTKIVALLADQYKAERMVFISTDKAVNPTNIMGVTKRIAEQLIQTIDVQSATSYITTRFGNVLGSAGSVVPRFKQQIEEGGPVTVTHPEINRYFMTISEAVLLVIEAAVIGRGGEIVLFDMGNPVKIDDLAKRMIQLSGKKVEIKYIGIRKGEKLFEELLIQEEETIATPHPKLKIAKNSNLKIFELEKFNELLDNNELINYNLIKQLVPEYNPIYRKN